MRQTHLPESIDILVSKLRVVQLEWLGVPIQVPHFAVYAVLDNPIIDSYLQRNGKTVGIICQGRYKIPVVDPFQGDISSPPPRVVIVSLCRNNHFGLFAYPADSVQDHIMIPASHRAVKHIVSDFL
jgi:hypothetical protein